MFYLIMLLAYMACVIVLIFVSGLIARAAGQSVKTWRRIALVVALSTVVVYINTADIFNAQVLQEPARNLTPKEKMTIHFSSETIDVTPMNSKVVAEYVSTKLSCSYVNHFAGGSVVYPRKLVSIFSDANDRYVIYKDYFSFDDCDWRLSGVVFYVTNDETVVSAGIGRRSLRVGNVLNFQCGQAVDKISACVHGFEGRLRRPSAFITATIGE